MNFGWLDICMMIVFVRACWIGFHRGVLAEAFKIAGLFFAIVIGVHFYLDLAFAITKSVSIMSPVASIFSYVILISLVIVLFRFFREGVVIFFKEDDMSGAHRFIGMVVGCCRAVLLGGLIVLGCLIGNHRFLTDSVRDAFLSKKLLVVGGRIYSGAYRYIIHPVFPDEEKNFAVEKMIAQIKHRPE